MQVRRHVLSDSKPSCQFPLSMVVSPGARIEHEASSITEYAIVNVSIFYYRMGIVPFAIDYEADAKKYRKDENRGK